MTKKGHQERVL